MTQLYGSLVNRLEENKIYKENKLIEVGDDITKYYWSDRTCYYVTRVIDQKHIFVKPYHICANHEKEGGMGHQNWMYFKSLKEHDEYLAKFFPQHYEEEREYEEEQEIELVFRYNKWKEVHKTWYGQELEKPHYTNFGNISFGVRDYYYDWEF